MPELHRLTPPLSVLQDKGFKVALVTDGRMSGASGKVPAAIHLSPESMNGGLIGKVQNGDMITLDCETQTLISRSQRCRTGRAHRPHARLVRQPTRHRPRPLCLVSRQRMRWPKKVHPPYSIPSDAHRTR